MNFPGRFPTSEFKDDFRSALFTGLLKEIRLKEDLPA
jgi:hypothetical protein